MDAKVLFPAVWIGMMLTSVRTEAYSVETHEHLSRAAVRSSSALSLSKGAVYYDLALPPDRFFPGNDNRYRTALDLVRFGAFQEDEIPVLRMRNHFFDPQNGGRPLTVGIELGFASPDWILEDRGPLPDRFPLMLPQKYSLARAHDYFLQALTSRELTPRYRGFGLLFQTLGHAIHHVQDMAQFEHVRNDQHVTGADTSHYEGWTKGRGRTLPMEGYPPIDLRSFTTARRFWVNQGKGIAEFTSRNFVSKDTNFTGRPGSFAPAADYPLPALSPGAPVEKVKLGDLLGPSGGFLSNAEVWFLGLPVTDANQPAYSGFNARASAYSIFTQELTLRFPTSIVPLMATTTLNRFNFAAAHEFLMPRAVAYSAGLLDYFFRGRLALDSFEVAGGSAVLKVRNASAANFAFNDRTDGASPEFALYYDDSNGMRHRLSLTGADLAGQALPVGGTRALSFIWPDDLAVGKDKPFMLVFEGIIGEEIGIAALAVELPSINGFALTPSYTPHDGISGKRVIYQGDSGWQTSARAGFTAGNVDWRGDEPGEVLTWDGPPSRYFYPEPKRGGYSTAIYSQGRKLTSAPANVQGVSIRTVAGAKWLTAVTYQNGQLRFYSRPLRAQYANDTLYDAQTNPDGWRQLYAIAESQPYTPVFFNSSGTEAQLITADGSRIAERVRWRLSGDTVTREPVSAVGGGKVEMRQRRTVVPTERTLRSGNREEQPYLGEKACVYTAACTDPAACSSAWGGEVCLLSQFDYASENVATVRNYERYAYERPTAVCVDYKGDTEVLCRIAYRGDIASGLDVSETDRFESRQSTANTCPPASSVTASAQRESYRESSKATLSNTMRVLRVGAVEVPLSGRVRESTIQSEHVRESSVAGDTSGGVYSGRKTQVEFDWSAQSRLQYVDARNDVVVYETEETKISAVSAWTPETTRLAWAPQGPAALHETTNREWIAAVGAARHSLWRDTNSRTSTSPLGSTGGVGAYGAGRPDCTPVDIDEHSERDTVFSDAADWSAIVHPRANDASQGYGIDRKGNLAASQTIWLRRLDGSYTADKVWNFLTGGELTSLLPAAPASASFYPIGVID